MRKICHILALVLSLMAIPLHAYHVGEKPKEERDNSKAPRITFVAADRVEFTTTTDDAVILAVYDVRGNNMMNNGLSSESSMPVGGRGSFRLSLENVASGIYFITLRNQSGISTLGVTELR